VQNEISRGALVPQEDVKRVLSGVSGSWRATIPECSYSAGPLILAVLEEKDPAADSRLRLLVDDESYAAAGRINRAMLRWIGLREARERGDGVE
jgi:hypothetical protein